MKQIFILATALLVIIGLSSLLNAEMYQWTDENGAVHFSDSPVDLKDKGEVEVESTIERSSDIEADMQNTDIYPENAEGKDSWNQIREMQEEDREERRQIREEERSERLRLEAREDEKEAKKEAQAKAKAEAEEERQQLKAQEWEKEKEEMKRRADERRWNERKERRTGHHH